jgi:hypothetical protein
LFNPPPPPAAAFAALAAKSIVDGWDAEGERVRRGGVTVGEGCGMVDMGVEREWWVFSKRWRLPGVEVILDEVD